MKKLLYLLFVVTLAASTFTACTDEEVRPNSGGTSTSGSTIKEGN